MKQKLQLYKNGDEKYLFMMIENNKNKKWVNLFKLRIQKQKLWLAA